MTKFEVSHTQDFRLYNNKIFNNALVNELLILRTRMILFICRNFCNLAFISHETHHRMTARREYLTSKNRSGSTLSGLCETRGCRSVDQEKNAEGLIVSQPDCFAADEAQVQVDERLSLPRWVPTMGFFMFILQTFLLIRCAIEISYLSLTPHRTVISTYNALGHKRPASLMVPSCISTAFMINNLSPSKLNASQEVLNYLRNRHTGFCIWSMSTGFSGGYEFLNRLMLVIDDYDTPAQFQQFGDERRAMHFMMSVLTVFYGIVSSILTYLKPPDIAAMLFICDPIFVAHRLHERLHSYLEMVRLSYYNYWSIYTISDSGKLDKQRSEGQVDEKKLEVASQMRRNPFDQSNVDCRSLSYQHFKNYLPSARGQLWRRNLIILLAPMVTTLIWSMTSVMTLGFYLLVVRHSEKLDYNRELVKIITFSGAQNNLLLPDFPQINESVNNQHQLLTLVELKKATTYLLLESLYRLDGPDFANKTKNQPRVEGTDFADNRAPVHLSSNKVGPIMGPKVRLVVIEIVTIVVFCALYGCVGTVTLLCTLDMALWMLELQMKLAISLHVVSYYSINSKVDRRNLPIYSIGGREGSSNSYNLLQRAYPSRKKLLSDAGRVDQLTPEMADSCNLPLQLIFRYMLQCKIVKDLICARFAQQLIKLDLERSNSRRRFTRKFLLSAYLDFRLFQDEINKYRLCTIYLLSYLLIHYLCILVTATLITFDPIIKFGALIGSCFACNVMLLYFSYFKSQCAKYYHTICSIQAANINICGDRNFQHLTYLWKMCLANRFDEGDAFAFKIGPVTVSYASTLQFNITCLSIYIILSGR